MSYESVIKNTKKIETMLVHMGASGKGLHAKLSSIAEKIDKDIVKSIRFIASVRNKLLHEDNVQLTEHLFNEFEKACEYVIDRLKESHTSTEKESHTSGSPTDTDELSGWRLLGIGIAGVIAIYSWFSS